MKHVLIGIMAFLFTLNLSAQIIGEKGKNTWRIMSYNIRNGRGMDDVTDLRRITDVINRTKPDVVAVQEVDSVTGRSNQTDILHELADQTLMYRTYAPAIPFDGGKYGVGILSKEKPINSRYIPLPGREERRTLLWVEFEQYIFACTHLSLTEEDRISSLHFIRREAEAAGKPFVLAGDWNDKPESPFMTEIQKDFQLFSNPKQFTFPAPAPKECIDYIAGYKTGGMPFTVLSNQVIDEAVASDHRPIVVDIRLKASKEAIFRAKPYLQNPTDGGITVMWQTRVPTYSWVEYGTDTLHLQRARTVVDGQVICNNYHTRIRLDQLEPGQKYYYRVCSREITLYQAYKKEFGETAVSPFYSFTLPTAKNTDFTAIIFNDLHKQEATLRALYDRVKEVAYDFVVFNGDCIDDPKDEEDALTHLIMQCETVGAERVPAFYLRGNHEIRNAYSIGLRNLFDYVGDKTYGAFNWGDTRIVMLDCGEDKPDNTPVYYDLNDFTQLRHDQIGFLREELGSQAFQQASRRILLNHIPIYGNGDDYHPSAELWSNQLRQAPFDINICGHTHRFAYHPKGTLGNNFPVVIGGSQRMDGATVMILEKKGAALTVRVLNTKGETIVDLNL